MWVAVFGGSTCSDEVGKMAEELGRLLAQAGHVVVTGGYNGVMSWVSKGAREAGGEVAGVVIEGVGKPNVFINPELVWTMSDFWERFAELMDLGDAYIALPGGSGTSLELLAALHTQANREKLMPGSPKKKVISLCSGVEYLTRISWLLDAAGGDYVFPRLLLRAETPQEAVAHLAAE